MEQKNWHVVRRNIGYGRDEGQEAVRVMNEFYAMLRLYTNFFMPHMKLVGKGRVGARTVKRYDMSASPFRRLLAGGSLPDGEAGRLNEAYEKTNPARLRRDMTKLLEKSEKLSLPNQ